MENLDSSIACRSAEDICSPLLSWSSMKVLIPHRWSASWRWSVKLLRVSSPLKLRKTSYFRGWVEEEDATERLVEEEAITNLEEEWLEERRVAWMINPENRNLKRVGVAEDQTKARYIWLHIKTPLNKKKKQTPEFSCVFSQHKILFVLKRR